MSNSDLARIDPEISSVARFQTLQSGQYWRALEVIPDQGIDAAEVLLIESMGWVDDAPHTVILRAHPDKIDRRAELKIPQADGSVRTRHITYSTHRFLLKDFLDKFEYEPDHQVVRKAELDRVQGRVNELTEELVKAQSDPTMLAYVVETELQNEAEAEAKAKQNSLGEIESAGDDVAPVVGESDEPTALPAVVSDSKIASMVSGTVSDALSSGITEAGIAQMRVAAEREHKIASIKAEWMQEKTQEIAATISAMTPYYKELAAAALAQTEDVRKYVAKLMSGIESLDLYVGKDVTVETIREGDHAPAGTPLTFVQRKLLMDEELAVWADVDYHFDSHRYEQFFKELRANDSLVNQIFPTERCVLVMASTRRHIDYKDSWTTLVRNKQNQEVFLLVRNGMNLYRVFSAVESHLGTARLFPSKDDQDRAFRGINGENVKFEDVAYPDQLDKFEQFALHYKRFLLLACGLDHRLKLFGDFYDGPQSFHFVSMDFQEKYCRFLHDDDGTGFLPGEVRQSLREWIKEKNRYLRSGARVLCNWGDVMNPDTAPGACKTYSRGEGFETRYSPKNKTDLVIAFKDGESFCVEIPVTGYSYSSHADRTFTCKVNLTKLKSSRFEYEDVPYLCLDAVDPDEMEWYINHRDTRINHLEYIRFFKRAVKFLREERASESDTRKRMADALAIGGISTGPDAMEIIDQAVIAWRAANRGKELPKFTDGSAPAAWASLLDQMYMLAGEGKRRVLDIEGFVRELGYAPLRLVLSGGAKLVVYAEPAAHERDDRLESHAWVHRIMVEKGKSEYVEKSRRWTLLPKAAASETTLHQWDEAEAWAGLSSGFETYEKKQKVFDFTSGFKSKLQAFLGPMEPVEYARQLAAWTRLRNDATRANKGDIRNPALTIPFGVVYYPKDRSYYYLCLDADNASAFLLSAAPDEAAREDFARSFKKKYEHTDYAQRLLDSGSEWRLATVKSELLGGADDYLNFYDPEGAARSWALGKRPVANPLMADWIEAAMEHAKASESDRQAVKHSIWLADEVVDDMGRIIIDDLLGIELPADYEPVKVVHFHLRGKENTEPAKLVYAQWYDIDHDLSKDSNSRFFSDKKSRHEILIEDSTPKGAFAWKNGYSSNGGTYCVTPEEAREYIAGKAKTSGLRAVHATELPDAPQPPAGVERWYLMRLKNA